MVHIICMLLQTMQVSVFHLVIKGCCCPENKILFYSEKMIMPYPNNKGAEQIVGTDKPSDLHLCCLFHKAQSRTDFPRMWFIFC